MTKRKTTKHALVMSILSLLMCVSMLVGSTFAWFTDTVTSGRNIIAAGNLDVEMYHSNATVNDEKVDSNVTLFKNLQGEPILWEPGVVSYENLRIVNEGDLALAYSLSLTTENENFVLNPSGDKYGLSQILKIGIVEGGITTTDRTEVVKAVNAADWTTLEDFLCCGSLLPENSGAFEETWGVVIYWEPGEDDNRWNLNNGKTLSEGDELSINLGVHLVATQEQFESDSFGADYDADAIFPAFYSRFRASATVNGKVDANNQLTEDVTIGNASGRMQAIVPKGTVLKPDTTKLILTVDATGRSSNIEMTRGQISRSLDVHIEGIAENNTVPVTVDLGVVMPKGLKDSSIQIYHVENDTPVQMTAVNSLTAHNQFVYNADNGEMTVNMATFSEVTAVVAAGDPWAGKIDTSWYNASETTFTIDTEEEFAGLGAIVGGMAEGIEQDDFAGKTVKLGVDLDLGGLNGQVWYPIGYHNSTGSYERVEGVSVTSNLSSFEGVFDGNGHTISNIYQNTWEMFGDYNSGYTGTPNYYKDGMGLFGFVLDGTVKNLTVNNFQSDGEFCTTGCVAAYAAGSATFENITITNSNPRAYNVPNGGVVGYAYAEDGYTNNVTFKNITVDSSNKISALWGSWDVGCGGILGRVNGATTVNMTDCEVGAVIDVYNDVCGNYQYYQYRYSGMLVGTVGDDSDPTAGAEKVNFSNVKVYIGNWADYYYCEFVKNSQGSYTDDYQFSRVEKVDINFDDQTNMPIDCKHDHIEGVEDRLAVYLPFKQLYTGYGWGANPVKEANGVTVEHQFYSITYKDAENKEVLAVEYVTTGERSENKLWADGYTVRDGAITTPTGSNQIFKGWVNAGSVVLDSIPAGNMNDIVLYESWTNPYTARFVDQFGNVIYTETFTSENRTLSSIPAVPEVEGFKGQWEEYQSKLDDADGDITIKPVYSLEDAQITLLPVDTNSDGVTDKYYVTGVDQTGNADVDIPAYLNGIPITQISGDAFADFSDIRDIDIPNTIEYIGADAFADEEKSWGQYHYETIQIFFDGTRAEWDELITKSDENWDRYVGISSVVVCKKEDPAGYYKLNGSYSSFLSGSKKQNDEWKWVSGEYERPSYNETLNN